MPHDPLTRIFDVIQPSPAMFLADCGLWSYPGPEEIRLALADLVADQRNLLDRAGIVLAEREQPRPRGAYPITLTSLHDVNLRHILPRVISSLEQQRSALEGVAATSNDAAAADLGADAVRSVRQHLDVLKDVKAKLDRAAKPAGSSGEAPAASAAT
jgi:heme exporter protein D